jgi:hypothetical protein
MPFCRIILLLLAWNGAGLLSLKALPPESEKAGKAVVPFFPLASEHFPLTFRSPEAVENPSRLEFCEKTMARLALQMGLSDWKKARFIVSWNDRASDLIWVDTFPRNIRRDGNVWVFTIKGQGNWKAGKEQLYRTLTVCLLQSRILPESGVLSDSNLPEPPIWLSEGLTQILMESRRDDFASAVWRFSLAQKVPSLEAIQDWTELSEDGIHRSWQQTFAFWLVTQATRTTADKSTLQLYLSTFLKEPGKRYWSAEGFNEDWWQRSTSEKLKQDLPGYDWEQSVARLRETTSISVKYKDDEGERLISITELPKSVKSLENLKPIDETRQKLTELGLRCHPLIKPVVAYYRNALEAWADGNIDLYAKNLRAARDQQKETTLLREQANDFLDWFTVNYAIDVDHSDYRNYAQLVEELESARRELRENELVKTTTDLSVQR